jgi:FkbM family methyltransferase
MFPEQSWEPKVWKALNHIRGEVFVDVGAYRGVFTKGLSKHFRNVMAFEPDPHSYELLSFETRKLHNVSLFRTAISDTDGETTLYSGEQPCPSILSEFEYAPESTGGHTVYRGTHGITVKTSRLDTLFNEKIDLLKIDVEGAEFLVLQGASRLLREGQIRRIVVELHNRDKKQALMQILEGYGYLFRWLDKDHIYGIRL